VTTDEHRHTHTHTNITTDLCAVSCVDVVIAGPTELGLLLYSVTAALLTQSLSELALSRLLHRHHQSNITGAVVIRDTQTLSPSLPSQPPNVSTSHLLSPHPPSLLDVLTCLVVIPTVTRGRTKMQKMVTSSPTRSMDLKETATMGWSGI